MSPDYHYALALTHSYALIWPYSQTTQSLSAGVFAVPFPETWRNDGGPVPLGTFLSTATAGPPGLFVIMPSTGRIVYWEAVPSAASLGLSEKRQSGIQGSISGMFSGEHAKDVINSEPSGIIVTFTSGRVAHVTLRDSQGKPNLVTNFLRDTSDYRNSGLLAGLKNVLGGGFWRKDVAAARTGSCHQRGQRDVIVATPAGLLEIWDTHWHNGSILKRQFNIGTDVYRSIDTDSADGIGPENLRILDFAFAFDPNVNAHSHESPASGPLALFVLAAISSGSDYANLSVVRVNVTDENTDVLYANPVGPHAMALTPNGPQPRLFVSGVGDTAFVVFEQSVTILSLAPSSGSDRLQHQNVSDNMRPIFQDRINFRSGEKYEILGYGFEDQSGEEHSAACLVMVRGFGIIRIASLLHPRAEDEPQSVQITAKDRLEQAVFYGSMFGNPLELVTKEDLGFPAGEVEQAALDISDELLQSKSKFLRNASISLDQQLSLRSRAMDDLIVFLAQQGKPLSRLAWWEILWAAEKLAAQRSMWKIEESFREEYGESTFLTRVMDQMSDKFKANLDTHKGDMSQVRQWFLYNSNRMEHLLAAICNAVKPKRGVKQGRRMAEQLLQAGKLSLAILETAFQYRDKHAWLYSSDETTIEDGILTNGYEGLPEVWTSKSICYAGTRNLLNFELETCRTWFQQPESTADSPDRNVVERIARNSSRHLRVLGQMHRERVRWLSSQDDPKLTDESIALEQTNARERKWQLFKLAGIDQLEDAISLAESFQDMTALVELIIELQDQTIDPSFYHVSSTDISDVVVNDSGQCAEKISLYFDRFGESWADAFFSRQIRAGQSGVLFAMRKFQPFVTRFLRKSPDYSRLSWINDVVGENEYSSAAKSLENLALTEPDVWSHHVELSLAKLTTLAASEEAPSTDNTIARTTVERLDDYASIDTIQEFVYNSILPVLHGAIDHKAAVELAIDHFGKPFAEDRPSLHETLCDVLAGVVSKKVLSVDQLVDLLTLVSRELREDKFFLALRVIHLSNYPQRDPLHSVALQKLIWRRCMIKDDWKSLGEKVDISGGDNILFSVQDTALFRTLNLCLEEGEYY